MTLAVLHLYDEVREAMALEGLCSEHAFGWREPARHGAQDRIVYVPGDAGALGDVLPPRYPGRCPRPIATVEELVTVYLEARAAAQPENEREQYEATRLLFDAWLRHVLRVAPGWARVTDARWVNDKNMRRAGATLAVVLAVDAMVPDLEPTTILPGEGPGGSVIAKATVTTELTEPPTILAETTTITEAT